MTDNGRILVADDEEIFLLSTSKLLRNAGYSCECASDTSSAIQMLETQKFDLLISDIRMPGNNELALLRGLPQMAKGMPAILVTGYPSIEPLIEAIKLPVSAYFTKPVQTELLLKQVRTSIEDFRIYRSTQDIIQRQLNALTDIIESGKVPGAGIPKYHLSSANAFFSLTIQNIAGGLLDLNHLANNLASHNPGSQEACHLFNCPRQLVLMNALDETVKVLEKTKRSFKSKELGNLRKMLTDILNNTGN